jgi:hypothetical protein
VIKEIQMGNHDLNANMKFMISSVNKAFIDMKKDPLFFGGSFFEIRVLGILLLLFALLFRCCGQFFLIAFLRSR